MILYHGSSVPVREPKLIHSRRRLDFGPGFYLTSDIEQARKWAVRTAANRGTGRPIVSVFRVDLEELSKLNVRTFSQPNAEWLDFVCFCRSLRSYDEEKNVFDVIRGPVADDQASARINDFRRNALSLEETIEFLLPYKLKDQFAFKTERALQALHFVEVKQA